MVSGVRGEMASEQPCCETPRTASELEDGAGMRKVELGNELISGAVFVESLGILTTADSIVDAAGLIVRKRSQVNASRRLTFDMSGGCKWAKPACRRTLDGRVRPHSFRYRPASWRERQRQQIQPPRTLSTPVR